MANFLSLERYQIFLLPWERQDLIIYKNMMSPNIENFQDTSETLHMYNTKDKKWILWTSKLFLPIAVKIRSHYYKKITANVYLLWGKSDLTKKPWTKSSKVSSRIRRFRNYWLKKSRKYTN